jgi:hypothetical protein
MVAIFLVFIVRQVPRDKTLHIEIFEIPGLPARFWKLVCSAFLTLGPWRGSSKNLSWFRILKGLARTQIPTNKNDAPEFPTFGEIAGGQPRPGGTSLMIKVNLYAR